MKYNSMLRSLKIISFFLFSSLLASGQKFGYWSPQAMSGMNFNKPLEFKRTYATSSGSTLIASTVGIWEINLANFSITPGRTEKKRSYGPIPNVYKDLFESGAGVKYIAEGPNKIIYFVSDSNQIGWIDYNKKAEVNYPPFNFPGWQKVDIRSIWIDRDGDMYVTAGTDTLYIVKEATKLYDQRNRLNFSVDNNGIITAGAKKIEKLVIGSGIIPYAFADNYDNTNAVFVGTSKGIYFLNKWEVKIEDLFKNAGIGQSTVTHIETQKDNTEIWFSTLEKGLGFTNDNFNTVEFFPYKDAGKLNSISTFTPISEHYFLVAVADSIPAVFNALTGEYNFIQDMFFGATPNKTTDVSINSERNIFIIKGGGLFVGIDTALSDKILNERSKYLIRPSLMRIQIQGQPYEQLRDYHGKLDSLKTVTLKYYETNLDISFAMRGVTQRDTMIYEWKMDGYQDTWDVINTTLMGNKFASVEIRGLNPGTYTFRVRAKIKKQEWMQKQIELRVVVEPPFWKTWWFWSLIISGIVLIVGLLLWWRTKVVKRRERERFAHEKQLLELEALALRAQMNPHFIFNCLNSIKSLMQEKENEKGITYLTTFSKLIRTLFNNADKKDISLYDEIETCKYYLQLEAMRFDAKFSYALNVDENIDLKSIQVPALIIQPFIENAIWHGIMPRNSGGNVSLSVLRKDGVIEIVIDDDGVGREASAQNKSASGVAHQSKGVNLTQSRLELNNLLQQRQAILETIDKKDEQGNATGTTVIIKIKEELS